MERFIDIRTGSVPDGPINGRCFRQAPIPIRFLIETSYFISGTLSHKIPPVLRRMYPIFASPERSGNRTANLLAGGLGDCPGLTGREDSLESSNTGN